MTQENVELVEAAFAAWNRGELDAFGKCVSEDIVWLEVSGWVEIEGHEVHGRDQLLRNFQRLLDTWESYRLEPEELHSDGSTVVAVVREVARGRASGLEVDSLWGYVVTIADGEMTRVEAYRDPETALARLR